MGLPTERHLLSASDDRFGFSELAGKLLDNVFMDMELPNCFGIYGNWGSGKTSLIKLIINKIESKPEIYGDLAVVYFEPWKYEYHEESDLLFALLKAIKEGLGIKDPLGKWLSVVGITTAALTMKTISGLVGSPMSLDVKKIKESKDIIEEALLTEQERWVDRTEKFKNEFETHIARGLEKIGKQKLLVIIDDLDRCLPENAVRLLEAVKNLLFSGNTLFVMAIDRRVMSEMITKKYQLYGEYGDEYLMKIIHYFYELPGQDLKQLTTDILEEYGLSPSNQDIGYIAELLRSFAKETRKAKHYLFGFCNRIKLNNINPVDQMGILGIRYFFLASLLLIKYPTFFSQPNVTKTLNDFRNMAHLRAQGRSDEEGRYNRIKAAYEFMKAEDRIHIEDMMLRTINEPGTPNPLDTIDASRLLQAYNLIK